ncbi:hypothetical protein [Intestinibacter bartlettii]|uniref:hypothetical protein n=1 Tax=Intestinibacter bartlettii TaxID=261299 RepID=UPI0008212C12|nr:hypothetical protein [Intestinibacter bartlettii]SCI40849.1 Uncharacterised protein [uncultured Clostridium sp.]
MDAMKYEGFVRGAFSIECNELINRGEDPLGLANADIFNMSYEKEYLDKSKLGVSTSIQLYNRKIFEDNTPNENDRLQMESLLEEALVANNSSDLISIIDEYIVLRDKYFTFKWKL